MLHWGISVDPICQFCIQSMEDRDHMFFKCSFNKRIWQHIMALCPVSNAPDNWNLLVEWGLKNLRGRSFRVVFCKVAWWVIVYQIWIQGNSRTHKGKVKSEEQIIKAIRRDVKAKMDSVKAPTSILDSTLFNNWHFILCSD